MPLRVRSHFGLRVAMVLSDPLHPYPHLLDASLADAESLRETVEAARAARKADVLRLRYLPVAAMAGGAARLPFGASVHVHRAQRVALAGADGSASIHSSSASKRRKRLARGVGPLRLVEIERIGERETALDSLLAWKRAWLRARRLSAKGFEDPAHLAALRRVAALGETGGLRVFALRAGDRTVAVECGFRGPDAHLSTVAAFDPEHAAHGPGVLLTGMVMDRCAAEGIGFYDFLPPETPFKARLADDRPEVLELRVPLTARGRLALLALKAGGLGPSAGEGPSPP